MVRATLDRLVGLNTAPPLVVANAAHAALVAAELGNAGHDPSRMILEPFGRNTAPAAAVAALHLTADGADPLMLLLPADHVIEDVASFHAAVRHAAGLAAGGALVTFGVVPTGPETGYGYIKTGHPVDGTAFHIERFVEKPDAPTAQGYLETGTYLWNSGMFVFRCSAYLATLGEHAPVMLAACRETMEAAVDNDGILLDADTFASTPADSIDYAVMEHTDQGMVVPLDAGWSDVGSWAALWDIADHDGNGNVLTGDVVVTDTRDSYIRSEHRLVTVAGLDGIVVVSTPDALLVTTVEKCQNVKAIVDILKSQQRPEAIRSTDERFADGIGEEDMK
jgi:mannose-1-phosphate guanylyltransferase/mannose-6-phosphate isomerase